MNPNKALWEKGDFTRIAASMRESGEALVATLGITPGHQGAGPRLRRRNDRAARRRSSARTCWASTSPATSSRPATSARSALGLANFRFQEGDASDLERARGRQLRPRRQHLRRDVRAASPFDVAKEMVRVTRPGGRIVMGNWIPGDPTLVAQILQDQLGLLAAAARGLRQPDDLGRRGARDRAVRAAPACAEKQVSFARDTYTFNYPGTPSEFARRVQELLRADHERLRRRRGRRPRGRAAERAGGAVQRAEHERRRTCTSIPATFLRVTVAV